MNRPPGDPILKLVPNSEDAMRRSRHILLAVTLILPLGFTMAVEDVYGWSKVRPHAEAAWSYAYDLGAELAGFEARAILVRFRRRFPLSSGRNFRLPPLCGIRRRGWPGRPSCSGNSPVRGRAGEAQPRRRLCGPLNWQALSWGLRPWRADCT